MATTTETNPTDVGNALQCLVGVNFELLHTELNGIFNKNQEGYKILVLPTALKNNPGVSLGEMIAEFKSAFGMGDNNGIGDSLNSLGSAAGGSGSINLDKLTFYLDQTFFLHDVKGTNKTTEYAVALRIDATEALPSLGFFRLKSLSLAVWNTNRATILNKMHLGDFSKLLPA